MNVPIFFKVLDCRSFNEREVRVELISSIFFHGEVIGMLSVTSLDTPIIVLYTVCGCNLLVGISQFRTLGSCVYLTLS